MKYFKEARVGRGHDPKGVLLDRVFSVHKNEDNEFVFMEECDGYFTDALTKEQSIEMLEELIQWIKEQ